MKSTTYAKAGVDINKISKIHKRIDAILTKTFQTRQGKIGQVLDIRQHYAGLIDIGDDYALAAHTDGVGTKVLVAKACRRYNTIGIDCIAMNVNDIICLGAEPLALVNYLALEKPQPKLVEQIMIGLAKGAQEAGVAIISGETAIMPDVVKGFDLAATIIGLVKKKKIITGQNVQAGDVVLGLRSSGIHSNGLTLARKLLLSPKAEMKTAKELLRPTRIYAKTILRLLNSNLEIHGLAHITGGGYSKLKRIGLKSKAGFILDNLPEPQLIFKKIQAKGDISDREMYRTFNMGTGFLVICPKHLAKRVKQLVPEIQQMGYVTNSRAVVISLSNNEFEVEKW